MISKKVYVAATRFGLGIRADEAGAISASPEIWLKNQISSPRISNRMLDALPSSSSQMAKFLALKLDRLNGAAKEETQKKIQQEYKSVFIDEMCAKLSLAVTTDTPFYERLVDFWSNHFAVSVKKGRVGGLAGAYEREAIRPYVMGKFTDMLLAVAHHPAMLVYLDNAQSIGPDSIAGRRQNKGLNENLAREIMELHTLGVNGGYTQTDVTTFAKVITGWSLAGLNDENPGTFRFAARRHEPGTQTILGRQYADDGEAQGVAVLRDLAAHPATARHIALKLARHFVADDPPQETVAELARVFAESGGDLSSVYEAMIALPQAWDVSTHPKIKSGYDLVVSAARGADRSDDQTLLYSLGALKFLGAVPFTADSPAGFPDMARDLAGPEAMVRRVEWAQGAAGKLTPSASAMTLAELTIGPVMSAATRDAIMGARHEREAVALLFGSPEFQKR